MKLCPVCGNYDCNCDLSPADECGNCSGPIIFSEYLARYVHLGGPDDSCTEINVDHMLRKPLTSH